MIKGYWERRYDKRCESIYLIDNEMNIAYTLTITAHAVEKHQIAPSTDLDSNDGLGILRAISEALQQGGYIPKAATDAELGATKYHLEDMRKLVLK